MRRRLYNNYTKRIPAAETQPGDLLIWNGGNNKSKRYPFSYEKCCFFVKAHDLKYIKSQLNFNHNVVGIVTIPGSHNNGNCGIMSIHCMYVDNGSVGTGRSSNATNFDMQVANWHQSGGKAPINWTNPDTSLDKKYKYPIHPNIVAANGGDTVTYHKCDSVTIRKNVCQIPQLCSSKFLNYYITEMEAEPSEWKIVDKPGRLENIDEYHTYATSTFLEYPRGIGIVSVYKGGTTLSETPRIILSPFTRGMGQNTQITLIGKNYQQNFNKTAMGMIPLVWSAYYNAFADFSGATYQKMMEHRNTVYSGNYTTYDLANSIGKYHSIINRSDSLPWHIPSLGELLYWAVERTLYIRESCDIISECDPDAHINSQIYSADTLMLSATSQSNKDSYGYDIYAIQNDTVKVVAGTTLGKAFAMLWSDDIKYFNNKS